MSELWSKNPCLTASAANASTNLKFIAKEVVAVVIALNSMDIVAQAPTQCALMEDNAAALLDMLEDVPIMMEIASTIKI